MYRRTDTVAVTPLQAIRAIRRAFGGDYAVEPVRLSSALEEAIMPGSEHSRNHIVRVFRMLMELGLAPADLAAAVAAQRETDNEPLPSSRSANPFGDELVESSVEPSKSRCTKDGRTKFRTFAEYHLPYAKLDGIDVAPHPPIETAVNLLTEQEFECAVVVKPSVFARHHDVEDPYGEGYRDLLCALAHRVRMSYQRHATGAVSASFLELEHGRVTLHPLARRWLERAERETPGDFLALPVQTGKRWRGSSMERVAWHCQYADFRIGLFWTEVPLPAYVALFELWFDPYRLAADALAIDCPGDLVEERSGARPGGLSLVRGRGNLHRVPRGRHRPDARHAPATGLTQ